MNTPFSPVGLDDDLRIRDFLERHGGAAGASPRREETPDGLRGWSEVYAADGHILRCEWFKEGGRTEMRYEERSPATP